MTSKNFKKIFLRLGLIVILMFLLLPTVSVVAGDSTYTYTVLAPLPGTTEGNCTYNDKGEASAGCQTTLQKYLPGAFSLAIGLSAVFAVVMIVLGGFQYMSSDALQGKEDGRNRVKNSVYGLVLVIAAYLILYTVNPNLLTLNLTIDAVEINAQYGTGGTLASGGSTNPCTDDDSAGCLKDAEIEHRLFTEAGITVYADPCIGNQTQGCVNLDGLQEATISGIIDFRKTCLCTINITGGSEGGHSAGSTHNSGLSLDVQKNTALDSYITSNAPAPTWTSLGPLYTMTVNGKPATFLLESNPPHWHITFR